VVRGLVLALADQGARFAGRARRAARDLVRAKYTDGPASGYTDGLGGPTSGCTVGLGGLPSGYADGPASGQGGPASGTSGEEGARLVAAEFDALLAVASAGDPRHPEP